MFEFKKLQYEMFLKNINTDLTLFENINTFYYFLDFNPFYLWVNLHHILKYYFNNFTYDIAKDGSWLIINDKKYLFDNTKSIVVGN